MGDYLQAILFQIPGEEEAELFAQELLSQLAAESVILPQPSDCTLRNPEDSYPPGPEYMKITDSNCEFLFDLKTNGVHIRTGRVIEVNPQGSFDARCPSCTYGYGMYDDFWDAATAWWKGEDGILISCPRCDHQSAPLEWPVSRSWGFGTVGATFWNWPPLEPGFVRSVGLRSGAPYGMVVGKY